MIVNQQPTRLLRFKERPAEKVFYLRSDPSLLRTYPAEQLTVEETPSEREKESDIQLRLD